MKTVRIFNLLLGVVIFSFGLLKFVSPFKDWYLAQIDTSGLPKYVYSVGIASEILTGFAFLLPFVLLMDVKLRHLLLILANCSMIFMMIAATIVHLIPQVPASVLPLKIKLPIIPLMFMAVAIYNLTAVQKLRSNNNEFS